MPIYEYICEKCGAHIEVMQRVSDAPLKRCQKCRGKLEKIVSRTSFQLKGSGWYATDYAGKASAPATGKTEKSPEKKTEAATSTQSASEGD